MGKWWRGLAIVALTMSLKFGVIGCGGGEDSGTAEPPRAPNVDERGEPTDSEKSGHM